MLMGRRSAPVVGRLARSSKRTALVAVYKTFQPISLHQTQDSTENRPFSLSLLNVEFSYS